MVTHQATKKAFTTRQHINAAMIEYFDSFNNQVTNMEACGGMILDLGVIKYMVKMHTTKSGAYTLPMKTYKFMPYPRKPRKSQFISTITARRNTKILWGTRKRTI